MTEKDTTAVIEALERLSEVQTFGDGIGSQKDLALAVLPKGKEVHDLTPYIDKLRDAPRRIVTTARVSTVDSLIDYVQRFKNPDTALFADDDPREPKLLAIVDYHGQGATPDPRFCQHRVMYQFPISDQLEAWRGISGQKLSHAEMASFINERQYDIANPPADWMLVEPKTIELLLRLLNISDDHGNLDDPALDNPGSGMTARDRRAAAADADGADLDSDDRYVPRSALYKLRQIRFGHAARMIQLARTVELSR